MKPRRSRGPVTYSIQDYLKAVYELTDGGQPATTNALALRLGISAASVTGMLQKMAGLKPALVTYQKHRGARLTPRGRRAALEVIRHHRLLETWLVRSLGYSWEDVHAEAETLEHVMSDDLERRISQALGNPAWDPHGEPIPDADLDMPADHSIALSLLRAGDTGTIRRVQPDDNRVLIRLDGLGLAIGSVVTVLSVSSIDGVVTLRVPGHKGHVSIGPGLTDRLFVEKDRARRRVVTRRRKL